MITKDFSLPTEEELTVQEINISTPALRAAAFHVGKQCEKQNNVRGMGTPLVCWTGVGMYRLFLSFFSILINGVSHSGLS